MSCFTSKGFWNLELGKWGIGKLRDGEIGKLGDWEIGKLGDWEIGKFL